MTSARLPQLMITSNPKPLLRLYGLTSFDRSAKVRWLLTELGLEFEDRWLDLDKKEFESADFLQLNPMGRVPVLVTDDGAISESGAICAYLADRYLDKGLAPQISSPARARYQQWMYFADATLERIQSRMMIIEDIPASELRTEKEETLFRDLEASLAALDQTLTKDSFLISNRFSAADIAVSYQLYWCGLWSELNAVIQKYPSVTSYLDRMKKMPSALTANVFSYQE